MTWSIVARDPSGAFGVAVASKFFAVGALCPAVRAGKGALSTQALINPLYARDGLALLDAGAAAEDVVRRLTEADSGRAVRQFQVVDAAGRTAAHTGAHCIEWCGHRSGRGFSVAGNMLAGPQVVDETVRAYEAANALPFPERLMAAMEAGEAGRARKRRTQCAAPPLPTTQDYPLLDMPLHHRPPPRAELRA